MITRQELSLIWAQAGPTIGNLDYISADLEPYVCAVCRGPLDPRYKYCPRCRHYPKLIDETGFCTYVSKGGQLLRYMYDYKARGNQIKQGLARPALCMILGIQLNNHLDCTCGKIIRGYDAWTLVPSTKRAPEEGTAHPLYHILTNTIRLNEDLPYLPIRSLDTGSDPRQVSPNRYEFAIRPTPPRVLVINDTWVSGSHIFSVAARLREYGTRHVSTLCLARMINPDFYNGKTILETAEKTHIGHAVHYCPWL
ncbi:hypothetical protein ACRQDN_04690 [Actinotignum sp. GS-2025e]|uniref:hypothetical protein n=1 Tax=Actinotignum sp. GS-2025e TaxID=3427278 RepID=UPI003F486D67